MEAAAYKTMLILRTTPTPIIASRSITAPMSQQAPKGKAPEETCSTVKELLELYNLYKQKSRAHV